MAIRVKVCGITRLEDALAAIAAGAQALGFIFHPASPRYIAPEQAQALIAQLPPLVVTVGVFVNLSPAEINRIAAQCRLDRVQLHGQEPYSLMAQLTRPAYRALRPQPPQEAQDLLTQPDTVLLLDAFHPELHGGTGLTANWVEAARLAQAKRLILAGGLTPDNVRQAVLQVKPWAVDVNSGVESAPGIKDHAKLTALFQALEGL